MIEQSYAKELLMKAVKGDLCETLLFELIELHDDIDRDAIKQMLRDLLRLRQADVLMKDDASEMEVIASEASQRAVEELLKRF